MVLTLIFYTTVYFTGKRNPEVVALDARQVVSNNARDITQPSTSSSSANSSALSIKPDNPPSKPKSINNDNDSDSDDESILANPKNNQTDNNLISLN
jgi:hypothetical protein